MSNARSEKINLKYDPPESRTRLVFWLFCLLAFVVLCRPQDLFPIIGLIRPALVMSALTLGFVALRIKDLPGPPIFKENQIKCYSALLLIMIVGIPWSLYARLSFEQVFTVNIIAVLFLFLFYKLVSSIERLSSVLLVSCLGNGLYSAFALSNFSPGTGRLAYGSMFDPNDFAFFALGFLPLNFLFISRDNPLWVRLACLGSFAVGLLLIFFTGSRGGFLGLCVAVFLFLVLKTQLFSFKLKIVFIAIGLVVFMFSPVNTERYLTIFTLENDYNIQSETGRLEIWKIGLRTLLENPITGVGVGCFGNAVGLDRQLRGADTFRWQTAHNSIVQIGTETGFIGLFLFCFMSLNCFRIFSKVKNNALNVNLKKISEMAIVGFLGLFVASLFLSQAYSIYFTFYFGLSAIVNQIFNKEKNTIKTTEKHNKKIF